METQRLLESDYDVVLGPCPGCQLWQIDYTYQVARTYVDIEMAETYDFGSEQPIMSSPIVNTARWHEVIEDALQEHLEECPHLQRALFDFG